MILLSAAFSILPLPSAGYPVRVDPVEPMDIGRGFQDNLW